MSFWTKLVTAKKKKNRIRLPLNGDVDVGGPTGVARTRVVREIFHPILYIITITTNDFPGAIVPKLVIRP